MNGTHGQGHASQVASVQFSSREVLICLLVDKNWELNHKAPQVKQQVRSKDILA